MLNYIWAVMIVIGIIYGAITGHMKEVTEAALQSAQDAVTLCFTMTGVMAFWVGLMQVAEESGLIAKLTRMLSPFISFMFPRIPQGHKSRDYISTNIIANVLGLYPGRPQSHGRAGKITGGAWHSGREAALCQQ